MNRIVSSQLAVSCKSYLQIPRCEKYVLSRLDEGSNKIVKLKKSSNSFNYQKIVVSIQNCIGKIRCLKFGNYDSNLSIFVECLKVIRGVSYFEHDEYVLFSLPSSRIQP